MDNQAKDVLLALLQVESQHRQRIDSIWTQFKDGMLAVHGMVFAVLASLVTVPGLGANERIALIAFTVILDLAHLLSSRNDVERSAAAVQADYAADYMALTGTAPPRSLYSRALKFKREPRAGYDGVSLLPQLKD